MTNGVHQIIVTGVYEGLPIEVVGLSDEYDAAFFDTYLDWSEVDWAGQIPVSREVLARMAEHES
jgi:hypothetical protein